MVSTKPTPHTWTLRFKHNRSTILLEVDPLQTLLSVRADLLQALQESNPNGELNKQKIPSNPEAIVLGRAVDRNNLKLGFETIKKDTSEPDPKGKGKAAVTGGGKSRTVGADVMDCPQGAGLKNADVVVFKFKTGNEDHDVDELQAEEWDVVIPTMEDTYGDDEVHDEGKHEVKLHIRAVTANRRVCLLDRPA
ncbi:unnamed protein product [Zymoseptoria tritici ST99CH_3D7]|uniref:Ubiquitin-like domain-containing protein n=1 Tax=Zymoseptoria tritici (strain ST99CH_3D7) TaxID=1276538 RepID=A0A1X7RCX9_ZYMT9|nr:unnamed protein product [Zymoseptoria tritici ST99CH_3D7]